MLRLSSLSQAATGLELPRPMQGFVYVVPDGLKTGAALRRWVDRGTAFVESLTAEGTGGTAHKRSWRSTPARRKGTAPRGT